MAKLITLKSQIAVRHHVGEREVNHMVKALVVSEMITTNEYKQHLCVVTDVGLLDKDGIHFGWLMDGEVLRVEINDSNVESIQKDVGVK